MTVNPIQNSFAFGEMSPRLRGRTNTERYRQSLETAENVLTYSHGNAVKRPGFRYLREANTEDTENVRLISIQFDLETQLVIELGYDNGGAPPPYIGGVSTIKLLLPSGVYVEKAFPAIGDWEENVPWDRTDLKEISYVVSTTSDEVIFAHESHPPQVLNIDFSDLTASTFGAMSLTGTPAKWGTSDYPHAVTIHAQRLWFAGSPSYKDTLWGSKPNNFYDFSLGTAQPDDGIEFEMSDRSAIEWIQGAKDLLVGTDSGEYVITSDGGVIIPADIQANKQSEYGSTHHEPAFLGNGVLYLSADKRRIRFMNYQFVEEGWVSTDITWPSEHLTSGLIKELHFKRSPDPFIWCTTEAGTLVSAIYEREQDNTVGWHRHSITGATILSACLIYRSTQTEVWIAVSRVIDGVTKVYIEKFDFTKTTSDDFKGESDYYLDCSILKTASGTGQVSGLSHLEGEDVSVVADGVYLSSTYTVSSGIIELTATHANKTVVVGIPYTGTIKTLPLEGINPAGTAQGSKRRYARLFLRVWESAAPLVNGIAPSLDDSSIVIHSDDLEYHNIDKNDRSAQVTITMPDPLPYDVSALFGEASMGTR